jgi:CxxC motif-containing protein (DUF1111 family)
MSTRRASLRLGLGVGIAVAAAAAIVGASGCVGGQSGINAAAVFGTISQDDINAGAYGDEDLFAVGTLVFNRNWTCGEGGGKRASGPTSPCVYDRRFGPETSSCVDCHSSPVRDGAGQQATNIFRVYNADFSQFITRSPPHVFGVAYVDLLAREMTAELLSQREAAIASAQMTGSSVTVTLTAKGLDFGQLVATPSGAATYMGTAVSADLIVRPFGIKGTFITLRQQNINAFINHMGLEAQELLDLNGFLPDHDNDGVINEVTPGQVSAVVAYQALLPVPSFAPVSSRASAGMDVFQAAHCADCHTPYLRLDDPAFALTDPHGTADTPAQLVDILGHAERPQLARTAPNGPVLVPLFSDLRRHNIGPGLADYRDVPLRRHPLDPGPFPMVPSAQFLSTRLWGVGSTGPYLHDGTAITLDDAIRRHDGDALESRKGYEALSDDERASLLDFLNSLILQHGGATQSVPNAPKVGGY